MFYRMMLILAGLGPSLILGGYSCQAQQVVVTITAQKQGLLKGTPIPQLPNVTGAVLSFSYELEVAAAVGTAASGAGAGKVQHSAIVFSRRSDSGSPEIYSALATGELLTSVKFEFFAPNSKPAEKPYYSIQLTNARVVKFNQQTGAAPDQSLIDTVSLSFEKIEEAFVTGNKTATAPATLLWSRVNNQSSWSSAPQ
jgi:type VI secretion system secreted protein Hcp